jgi:hypothetical protein
VNGVSLVAGAIGSMFHRGDRKGKEKEDRADGADRAEDTADEEPKEVPHA